MKLYTKLTRFELCLWITSVVVIVLSFFIFGSRDYLTLAASVVGVTALIFVAKGNPLGQLLGIIFAVLYGIISWFTHYYGEMITYLCMSAPIALITMIEWIRHPYKDTAEAEVANLDKKKVVWLFILTAFVTFVFYFILKALGNAQLAVSTLSIATSFSACYLMFMRSPYYALVYGLNDIVLIVLWAAASLQSLGYVPMVACFSMFLLNDIYGFYSWSKMKKNQSEK